MSEHSGTHAHHPATAHPVHPRPQPPLFRIAGALGIASAIIGLLVFLVACFGFQAVMPLGILPLLLGAAGLIVVIAGGMMYTQLTCQDTDVLAALFINLMGLIGGLLLVAVWRG